MGHFENFRIFLLFLVCWNVEGSNMPDIPSASSFLPGKFTENQTQDAPSQIQQFEIPAHLVPSGLMSMGTSSSAAAASFSQPPPSINSAASNATSISLLSQATNFGEGMSSNWEISDVSIEGEDASLDVLNDGFSSLGQWAQTLQETEFVLEEVIALENLLSQEVQVGVVGLETENHQPPQELELDAMALENLLEQVLEEEVEEVVELQEESEFEEHPKNISAPASLQLPVLAPLEINIPPVDLSSISNQDEGFSAPETVEVEVAEAPKNNTSSPSSLLTPLDINFPTIEMPSVSFQNGAVPPTQNVEVVAIAPSSSTPVMVEYTPLSEYGWHGNLANIANTVGGTQNTGGSQIMSMNLSGNLMDVNATQNVNVLVSTHGLGSSSSVQVVGDGNGWGKPYGLPNKKPEIPNAPVPAVPKRVTVQLRAPPPGKALVYQYTSNPKYY